MDTATRVQIVDEIIIKLRLKIDIVSYPVRAEGLVNMHIYQMT